MGPGGSDFLPLVSRRSAHVVRRACGQCSHDIVETRCTTQQLHRRGQLRIVPEELLEPPGISPGLLGDLAFHVVSDEALSVVEVRATHLDVEVGQEVEEVIEVGAIEREARLEIFVLLHGLQRFRDLRKSDDDFSFSMDDDDKPPSPDKLLGDLVREGPALGVHTLAAT